MTRRQWLAKASRALQGTEAARRVAELLLCVAVGIDRVALIIHPDTNLTPETEQNLNALLARRLAGEPVAYLLGLREFYGRDFEVNPATLVPRPETECLVDEALARLPEQSVHFADLGTGSGCLAVTLAAERSCWQGEALDVSEKALTVARRNAERLEVADRLSFRCADFTHPGFWDAGRAGLHLVISNPPYISETEYAELAPGVRDYEPLLALVPGPTGLEHAAAVVGVAWSILRAGGLLLMEHGASQGAATRELCPPKRWSEVKTGHDLTGLDRYLIAVHR